MLLVWVRFMISKTSTGVPGVSQVPLPYGSGGWCNATLVCRRTVAVAKVEQQLASKPNCACRSSTDYGVMLSPFDDFRKLFCPSYCTGSLLGTDSSVSLLL